MRIPKYLIPLMFWIIISVFTIAFAISSSIGNIQNVEKLNIVQTTSILICPLH